jgi:integration host factor subunit alpha
MDKFCWAEYRNTLMNCHSSNTFEILKGPQMTLTKDRLIESIAGTGTTKKEASRVVETMLETIKTTLENGEDVLISGFGKFSVNEKKERRGRNPQTGHDLMLDPRRVVTFSCSGVLKDRLNQKKPRR